MKRVLFIILLLITLMAVNAEVEADRINQLVNLQDMTMNFNTDMHLKLVEKANNAKLDLLEINQSFVPFTASTQTLQSINSYPEEVDTKVNERNVIYTITGLKIKQYNLGLNGEIKTKYNHPKIKEKVPFPLKINNQEILKYTKPTENIDSDNAAIAAMAQEIIGDEDDMYIAVNKLATWVEKNINYSLTTLTSKATQKSSWVLENKYGVCDELTSLFIAMARSQGIAAKYVSGMAYTNFNDLNDWGPHAWAEVYFGKYGWVPFDITYHEFGFLDATHIKFKESVDSSESTTNFRWINTNVNLDVDPLNITIEAIEEGERIEDDVTVTARAMEENIGLNSYNLIEVELENNQDYYRTYDVYLTYSDIMDLVDGNHRTVILKPNEKKRIYFTIKVNKKLESGYVYKIPLMVYTQLENKEKFEIVAKESYADISRSEVEKRKLSNQIQSDEDGNLELNCYSDEQEYMDNEEIIVNCNLNSKLKRPTLKFCVESGCKDISYLEERIQEYKTNYIDENPGRKQINFFLRDNGDIAKYELELNIKESPKVQLKETIDYKMNENLISFRLDKVSSTNPRQMKIKLLNKRYSDEPINTWEISNFESNQKFNLYINGNELIHGKNKVELIVEYKDENNKEYKREFSNTIEINKPFFERLMDMLTNLFK